MRKPFDEEKVRCPDSATDKLYPPEKAYSGTKNPNPCPWGGLPVPIIHEEKKESE